MLLCMISLGAMAQPSGAYLNTLNSYMPGSPEAAQMRKYQDYPVNLFTGTPSISVPIYTLMGKGISVPITLSYHAAGGVRVDDQATAYGLGWSLNVGEISREQRGGPDEGGSGTTGFLGKPDTMYEYIAKLTCCAGTYNNQQMWVDAMNGSTDLEPDIFYFSFGGQSGKFVYDDSLGKFVCLTDNPNIRISFDHATASTVFTIISDGNKYVFAARQSSSSSNINKGASPSASPMGPSQTSSWKLTKVVNADATDSIILNYVGEAYTYYSGGSNVHYQTLQGPGRNPIISYSNTLISGNSKLSSITGKSFSVDFVDGTTDRLDLVAGNKPVSKIIVKNKANEVQNIFVLHHGYFQRAYPIGISPVPGTNDVIRTSLRLDSISEYGNSESNANPLRHAFTYNATPLPARLSFAKDWWGYPNYNTYANSLVPPTFINASTTYPGSDRQPDPSRIAAGILTGIRVPTGGTVTYEYEPNTTTTAVQQSKPVGDYVTTVSNVIAEWLTGSQTFVDSVRNFIIDEAPNGSTNNFLGGVIANISINPTTPSPSTAVVNVNGYPYFTITKTGNVTGTGPPTIPFSRNFQQAGVTGLHLQNGKYQMKFHVNGYNSNLPPVGTPGDGSPNERNISFVVTYDQLNTSGTINYMAAGVRVKSITTRDPYSNISNKRTFRYHKPENDSSYGAYLGSAQHTFIESSQFGQWQVRMSDFNMPGMGNVAASIVYPKVIEEVSDDGVTYRTEHYFRRGLTIYPMYGGTWPFVPAEDMEAGRGDEYMTIWNKHTSSGFTPAKSEEKIYNANPSTFANPNKHFRRQIFGIKCAATSYDYELVTTQGYAPPFVNSYLINTRDRVYVTSDTTITYDLNNQYVGQKVWNDYVYGDNNNMPMITRTGNSDGSVSIQKNYYVQDKPDANSNIASMNPVFQIQLVSSSRKGIPLGTIQFKDGQKLSQQYTYGHFKGNALLIDSVRQAMFSNALETELKVTEYDDHVNPLTIALRGNRYRKYLWYKAEDLPLATCVMSQDGAFFFSSFEYPDMAPSLGITSATSFSGSKAYNLGGNSIPLYGFKSPSGLDVYAWATGPGLTANSVTAISTGKTKDSWTLYKVSLGATSSVTISGNTTIDQLIVVPSGSTFEGNIYDSQGRVSAKVDNAINTTFYEYDNFGRLLQAKDEKGYIRNRNTYQYQGAQ